MELRRDGAARQYDFIMEIQNGEKLFKSFSPVYAMESKKKKKKKKEKEGNHREARNGISRS